MALYRLSRGSHDLGIRSLSSPDLGRLDGHDWDEGGHVAKDIQKTNQLTDRVGETITQSIGSLQRTSLSCGRMNPLLAHPLPPSFRQRVVSLFLSLPVCRRSSLLTEAEGGKGWPKNQIMPRESLAHYKSSSILSEITRSPDRYVITLGRREYIAHLLS
jgi:hypothetical protein